MFFANTFWKPPIEENTKKYSISVVMSPSKLSQSAVLWCPFSVRYDLKLLIFSIEKFSGWVGPCFWDYDFETTIISLF